ncbi:MAG: hypothetical protein ACRDQY_19925 [Pseudonocardiaceae bacterium]
MLAPVAGLSSTTAAGLARRFTDAQWHAVETGIGDIHTAMLAALAPQRAAALCETVTIDLDTTDVEVYGRHKRGVAYNYQGQRCGRPHVATWAETATALAADLLAGNEDPRRPRRGPAAPCTRGAGRPSAGRAGPAARRRRLLRWPAPRCRPTWSLPSAPSASPRCGRPWPVSPSPSGSTRSTWTARRLQWPATAPTGGPQPPGC